MNAHEELALLWTSNAEVAELPAAALKRSG
jgi:hypothetical protein